MDKPKDKDWHGHHYFSGPIERWVANYDGTTVTITLDQFIYYILIDTNTKMTKLALSDIEIKALANAIGRCSEAIKGPLDD